MNTIPDLGSMVLAGFPLSGLVMLFVQLVKVFKNKAGGQAVAGNWLLLAALILGQCTAWAWLAVEGLDVNLRTAVLIVIYGLLLGGGAVGVYETAKRVQ